MLLHMSVWARRAAAVVMLNVGLAVLIHEMAPPAPLRSDREAYEYVGRHGLDSDCGWAIYCYRVLVPVVLERIPVNGEQRWRLYQVGAAAAAGGLTSIVMLRIGPAAAFVAGVMAQTSYGFAFTAYDPYSAEAAVFAIAAAILWCWADDRWLLAWVVGTIGVFAKESVALVSSACALAALALAALAQRRADPRRWIAAGAAIWGTLLGFHWLMDTYRGWGVASSPAAAFSTGSWLALWWKNNPFLVRKLYLLFAPFGFGWLFAALGFRFAGERLRYLALGAIVPFLALCYVQTPERALANAFFVVVPLAAIYLTRAPFPLALLAAVTNGAVTAKVGSSTTWLPSSGLLLGPAALAAAWVVWTVERGRASPDVMTRASL